MKEAYEAIFRAKMELDGAVRSGNGVHGKRQILANVLVNNLDAIMQAFESVKLLQEKNDALCRDIESLNAALEEADNRSRKGK